MTAPDETATERLDKAIAARAEAENQFRAELAAAHADGISANEIARRTAAAGVASRVTVLRLLGAETVREAAAAAVRASEWGQAIELDVRRGGRVIIRIDQSVYATDRLRAAYALETQLRSRGLYLTAGGDDPALTPCEDLANGDPMEILKD